MPAKQVIHVRNDSANGRAVERAQAAMRRWHDAGYAVCPVPADGRDHPYGTPCPACSPAPEGGGTAPDEYGGHEFAYESATDLFRCATCRVYEVVARRDDGTIAPCAGPRPGEPMTLNAF
jgi:hypothetical protein